MLPSLPADPTLGTTLSSEDVALYDRQIRLWGLAAQQRIRSASVVIAAADVAAPAVHELAKDLVLKGVGRLALVDLGASAVSASRPNFAPRASGGESGDLEPLNTSTHKNAPNGCASPAEALAAYARELNPAVDVAVHVCAAMDAHDEAAAAAHIGPLVAGASVVLVVDDVPSAVHHARSARNAANCSSESAGHGLGIPLAHVHAWDAACRADNVPLAWLVVAGARFMLMLDFGPQWSFSTAQCPEKTTWAYPALADAWAAHRTACAAPAGRIRTTAPLRASPLFAAWQDAIDDGRVPACDEDALSAAPTAAIAGAYAAQEALKAVTARDRPLRNVVFFDARTLESHVVSAGVADA